MGNQRPILYIGVTSNLVQRVAQHKNGTIKGFTSRYKLNMLLYYELHTSAIEAISREKNLKKWKREWKLQLIRSVNPAFNDLYSSIQ
jgi:putative endonuclease